MCTASFILFLGIISKACAQDVPTVTTSLGKVQGHYLVSYAGNNYKAFEGIPYALPPVGKRRFEDPEPAQPWPGSLTANQFKTACFGLYSYRRDVPNGLTIAGAEDCLYLNVYVPNNAGKKLLPVMFYVYGGGFQYSTLNGNEQLYLIDNDIIFVSVNYRHGVLGFLSTQDNVVSGNMGLKDQALALRWVSQNIQNFGGDPKQVTLFGLSSGAAMVHYNYFSPLTAGLFKSGVSFSGTVFDCWALAEETRAKTIKLGELLGCPTGISETVDCLRGKAAYDLMAAQTNFMQWQSNESPFGPVIEKSASKPFIDRPPIDMIRSGDIYAVPWITGLTSEEGLVPVAGYLEASILEDLNKNWESIAPHLLEYYNTIPKDQHVNVARKIRQYYFGTKPINKENIYNLTYLIGDRWYAYNAVKAAKEQANRSPVWFYYYSYRATDSLSNYLSGTTENLGVCHSDDVLLVLATRFVNATKSTNDFAMHNDLAKFWLSVARTGQPDFGPNWPKIDTKKNQFQYLHIAGPGNFKVEVNNDLGKLKFWESINFNENKMSS